MLRNLLINFVMHIQPKTKDGKTFVEPMVGKIFSGLPLHGVKRRRKAKTKRNQKNAYRSFFWSLKTFCRFYYSVNLAIGFVSFALPRRFCVRATLPYRRVKHIRKVNTIRRYSRSLG